MAAVHEDLGRAFAPGRVALVRGGWPDNVDRARHLEALSEGWSWFAPGDLVVGVAHLRLTTPKRTLATELIGGTGPREVEMRAAVLDAVCGEDLVEERQSAPSSTCSAS